MKDIWLAQWEGDTSPQFASSTFEKLMEEIDVYYGIPEDKEVVKGKFKRNMAEFDECRYGFIEYTNHHNGIVDKDVVNILNYYYD